MRVFRSLPILVTLVGLALVRPTIADDTMHLAGASAAPGATDVPVIIAFTNDDVMQGYSIAVEYDSRVLACTDVNEVGGHNPAYFQYLIDEQLGSVVIGAILDLEPNGPAVIEASPNDEVDMVELLFATSELAMPGLAQVELVSGVGTPPVDNLFSVDGRDRLVRNLISDGIEISNSSRYFFREINAWAGYPFTAILTVDHQFELQALQIELNFDEAALSVEEITAEGTEQVLAGASGESNIEFLEIEFSNLTGTVEVAMIFDLLAPILDEKVLPPGEQSIIELRFDQTDLLGVGDETVLEFTNDGLVNLVTHHGGAIGVTPELEHYAISLQEPPDALLFIRGAMNSDSSSNMADAIFLFQYIFMGGNEPSCLKAADYTDSGTVDIADAIRLLTWLFSDGGPPSAPFPECGIDPTPDGLTCASGTSGCN